MKTPNVLLYKRMARQRGVGLIELMISIVIGLILVLLVSNYYLSSRQSYQTTIVSSEITDSQRYAVQLITRQLLLAGYSDYWFNQQTEFTSLPAKGSVPAFGAGQVVASNPGSDRIWIRFRPAALENQQIVACDNQIINEPIDTVVVMQLGVNTDQALFCKRIDTGGGSVPLLNGVDAMAFDFLDDSDAFQPAGAVADWSSVRAVRLNLILRSETATFDTPTQQVINWPGGNRVFNDRQMRARMTRVVALRNNLGGI
ncbi:PilW family protein [Halomonas sp. GXIMD04776]|uniref:PilW family protein n=1 Tax=Halomonas sp. GXIMD04776 TaxID=3415605 RepID=UPI003CC341BC